MNSPLPSDKYTALPSGDIISTYTGKPLIPNIGTDGYCRVGIYIARNKVKRCYIHRIIAETFLSNPDGKEEINHIDGDKTNNMVSNLEWCTRKHNMLHAYSTGLKTGPHLGKLGAKNHNSKPVRGINHATGEVVEYAGASEAARQIGKSKSAVLNVLGGRRKTSGGFSWEYL